MAKSKRQKLIKEMDDLCRAIIRLRDDDTCQMCQKKVYGSNSHPSHVLAKSTHIHLRHDLLNIKLLCFHCHKWIWHIDPLIVHGWFKDKFPDRYDYLMSNRHDPSKDTITELEDRRDALKEKLKQLKGE